MSSNWCSLVANTNLLGSYLARPCVRVWKGWGSGLVCKWRNVWKAVRKGEARGTPCFLFWWIKGWGSELVCQWRNQFWAVPIAAYGRPACRSCCCRLTSACALVGTTFSCLESHFFSLWIRFHKKIVGDVTGWVEWSCGGCSVGVCNKGLLNVLFLIVVFYMVLIWWLISSPWQGSSCSLRLD